MRSSPDDPRGEDRAAQPASRTGLLCAGSEIAEGQDRGAPQLQQRRRRRAARRRSPAVAVSASRRSVRPRRAARLPHPVSRCRSARRRPSTRDSRASPPSGPAQGSRPYGPAMDLRPGRPTCPGMSAGAGSSRASARTRTWVRSSTAARVEGFHGRRPRNRGEALRGLRGAGRRSRLRHDPIPEGELRDVYLPPFRAAVEAGPPTSWRPSPRSTACRRPPIPGSSPTFCAKEWGLTGSSPPTGPASRSSIAHGIAADGAEAARKAILAGVDMDMMSELYYPPSSRRGAGRPGAAERRRRGGPAGAARQVPARPLRAAR